MYVWIFSKILSYTEVGTFHQNVLEAKFYLIKHEYYITLNDHNILIG